MSVVIYKRTGAIIEQVAGINSTTGFVHKHDSINAAKRESRKLQAAGARVIRGKK